MYIVYLFNHMSASSHAQLLKLRLQCSASRSFQENICLFTISVSFSKRSVSRVLHCSLWTPNPQPVLTIEASPPPLATGYLISLE